MPTPYIVIFKFPKTQSYSHLALLSHLHPRVSNTVTDRIPISRDRTSRKKYDSLPTHPHIHIRIHIRYRIPILYSTYSTVS